jgi:5-methylcytosine-specific restriction endonuclease McrA
MEHNNTTENKQDPEMKLCAHCGQSKPVTEFLRRTGKRSGKSSRRGACRDCRNRKKETERSMAAGGQDEPVTLPPSPEASSPAEQAEVPKRRVKRPLPELPPRPEGPDASILRPTRQGIVRMRGRTDKGRRWHQETDLETAVTLVREHAAVVVNRHTIRRVYNNKTFRRYILMRDRYTCHFCGEYGDTIDHLLPRAKGGHTTPANCVCACNLCNQSKAARSLDEFMEDFDED